MFLSLARFAIDSLVSTSTVGCQLTQLAAEPNVLYSKSFRFGFCCCATAWDASKSFPMWKIICCAWLFVQLRVFAVSAFLERRLHVLSDWIIITLITNQVKAGIRSISIPDVTWRSFRLSCNDKKILRIYCCIADRSGFPQSTLWRTHGYIIFITKPDPMLPFHHNLLSYFATEQQRSLKNLVVEVRKGKESH